MSISSGLGKIQKGVEKGCWRWGPVSWFQRRLQRLWPPGGTGTSAISPAFPKLLAASVETNPKLGWTPPSSPHSILYGPARLHITKFLEPVWCSRVRKLPATSHGPTSLAKLFPSLQLGHPGSSLHFLQVLPRTCQQPFLCDSVFSLPHLPLGTHTHVIYIHVQIYYLSFFLH